MPDANGFWTADEQNAYRAAGDAGAAPGTTEEQQQARREELYGNQLYTDPTGQAVRGWEGSWQADPLAGKTGGSVWMPGEAGFDWGQGSASRANPAGFSTMLRDMRPDTFGAGSNLLNTMQGRGLYGGGYNPMGEGGGAEMRLPARSRQAAANPGGRIPVGGGDNPFQAFMDWFGGKQQWEPGASMMDFTGRAPFNPRTGQNLGGPTDLGAFYGSRGIRPPVVGSRGQSFLPGYQNTGTSYSTQLMQNNPGLFATELQQQQLQNPGQTVSGSLSPWLPAQLTGGQPMANPAPGAYATQGIHQGGATSRSPSAMGGAYMGPPPLARPPSSMGGTMRGGAQAPPNFANMMRQWLGGGLGGGNQGFNFPSGLFAEGGGGGYGRGGGGYGLPGLSQAGGMGGGVADMLSLIQGLQTYFGGQRGQGGQRFQPGVGAGAGSAGVGMMNPFQGGQGGQGWGGQGWGQGWGGSTGVGRALPPPRPAALPYGTGMSSSMLYPAFGQRPAGRSPFGANFAPSGSNMEGGF